MRALFFHLTACIHEDGTQICGFVVQDESDVLTALCRLEEMHISVEALKVGLRWHLFAPVFVHLMNTLLRALSVTLLFDEGLVLLCQIIREM